MYMFIQSANILATLTVLCDYISKMSSGHMMENWFRSFKGSIAKQLSTSLQFLKVSDILFIYFMYIFSFNTVSTYCHTYVTLYSGGCVMINGG